MSRNALTYYKKLLASVFKFGDNRTFFYENNKPITTIDHYVVLSYICHFIFL